HSEKTKQKMSKAKQGKYDGQNNPNYGKYGKYASNWRNGKTKNNKGYVLVLKPEHPLANNNGRIYEHRLIMEEKLGRYLTKDEVVHHINNKKDDNRIENLILFTNESEHQKYHKQQAII
ncbi:MAG: HNH endonuclease, partial [Candidatus Heimdallarchaeaceae archaeon]